MSVYVCESVCHKQVRKGSYLRVMVVNEVEVYPVFAHGKEGFSELQLVESLSHTG